MNWKVQLFRLNYDEREYKAVQETLESGWITMGQRTIDFEDAFAKLLGEDARCVAVANGTAALHIAVLASGVGPGDEVIVPSLTFVADLNSVTVTGARVVITDVKSRSDWTVDPADVERKITKKTRAIMIVHYAGYACDMDAILSICRSHNLRLIEDCAHAPGAEYRGRKLGTFGDFAAWSFFTNKNLAVGEGGMVTVRDAGLLQKCRNLRSHGMTVASFDRMKGRAVSYDVVEPGFNYRIDEIRAALGLVQLGKLREANARRAQLTQRYFSRLGAIRGIHVPFREFNRGAPSYHIMPMLLDDGVDRAAIIESLKGQGIQTSIHYPSIQSFTAYKSAVGPTPISQYISEHELTLPLYPTMLDADVDLVCDSLEVAMRG